MVINEVTGNVSPLPSSGKKKERDVAKSPSLGTDKVVLSEKARALYETEEMKKLAEVQKRIQEGFYERREVMTRVVDRMISDVLKTDGN